MKLTFEHFDGRSRNSVDVIDEATGKIVGYITAYGVGNLGGIKVSLFDQKYEASLNRFEECYGFVKGVEAVLNHMTHFIDYSARTPKKRQSALSRLTKPKPSQNDNADEQ